MTSGAIEAYGRCRDFEIEVHSQEMGDDTFLQLSGPNYSIRCRVTSQSQPLEAISVFQNDSGVLTIGSIGNLEIRLVWDGERITIRVDGSASGELAAIYLSQDQTRDFVSAVLDCAADWKGG